MSRTFQNSKHLKGNYGNNWLLKNELAYQIWAESNNKFAVSMEFRYFKGNMTYFTVQKL